MCEHFHSAQEMGGWYTGQMLQRVDARSAVYTQLGVLGPKATHQLDAALSHSDPGFLIDSLHAALPEATGFSVVRAVGRIRKRRITLMAETHDTVTGLQATFLVTARRSHMTEHLGDTQVSLIDLAGIPLEERKIAAEVALASFQEGMQLGGEGLPKAEGELAAA